MIRSPLALVLLVACSGGSGREAEEPEPPCGGAATCDPVDLRALAAVGLDGGRVAIAAYDQRQRGLVVGVATARDGAVWAPEALRFTLLAPRAGKPLAMAREGTTVALVYGASQPPSVKLARIDVSGTPRIVEEVVLGEGLPADVAIAAAPPGLVAAWIDPAGAVNVSQLAAGAAPVAVPVTLAPQAGAAIALGSDGTRTWIARAGGSGVEVLELGGAAVPTGFGAATAIAMHGAHVVWTDADGVQIARAGVTPPAPVRVDDGARAGEPAHRVGAALALDVCPDGVPLLAYQDQTTGALVTARVGPTGPARTESLEPRWTGAMHTAVACPLVLDLAARSAPLRVVLRAR